MSATKATTATHAYAVVDANGAFLVVDFDDERFVPLWTSPDALSVFCQKRRLSDALIKVVYDLCALNAAVACQGISIAMDPTWLEEAQTWTFGNVSRVVDLSTAEAV